MIIKVKKVYCKRTKELRIYSAVGKIVSLDGEDKIYLEDGEPAGRIEMDGISAVEPCAGRIVTDRSISRVKFALKKTSKDGKKCMTLSGSCLDENGREKYTLSSAIRIKKSSWIFTEGYQYYILEDKCNGGSYRADNITFAADMHYYYLRDEAGRLLAVIYKPYRNRGMDEYHIYTKLTELEEALLFLTAYIDNFFYPYNSAFSSELDEYNDNEAYDISDDELLQLYDEDFERSVILDEGGNENRSCGGSSRSYVHSDIGGGNETGRN